DDTARTHWRLKNAGAPHQRTGPAHLGGAGPHHGDSGLSGGAYPVEALKISSLPKAPGQSPSGHGAGKTRWPAVNDACRQASMAGQSTVRRVSVQTPAPYVRVATA